MTIKALEFDGLDDFMDGGNFADNLESFTVFTASDFTGVNTGTTYPIINKRKANEHGWNIDDAGQHATIVQESPNAYYQRISNFAWNHRITAFEFVSRSEIHVYEGGVNVDSGINASGTVEGMSNTEHVLVGGYGGDFTGLYLNAVMIYIPAPSAEDRAAIEQWLSEKYSIPLR